MVWTYIFVRTDLPQEQVLVQACHAAQKAGLVFPHSAQEPDSLVIIQVKNKEELEKAYEDISNKGIGLIRFEEPDWDYGLTAFASEPIHKEDRSKFRGYKLLKFGS